MSDVEETPVQAEAAESESQSESDAQGYDAIEEMSFSEDELSDDEAEPKEEAESESEQAEPEEADDPEPESSEEPKESEPEAEENQDDKKKIAQEAFKLREEARKAREEAEQLKKAKEADDIKRYLAEAEDDEIELAQRELNVKAYRLQQRESELHELQLQTGIERALSDTLVQQVMNSSEIAKNELLEALDQFELANVRKDENGLIQGVNGDIYQHLVKKANAILQLTRAGASEQVKSKAKESARTFTPPARTPKEPKADKDLADFDKVWDS